VREAPAPVAVMPPGAESAFSGGPIACAVSLGDGDEAAVRFAVALATATGRSLALARVRGAHDAALLAATRARTALIAPRPSLSAARRARHVLNGGLAALPTRRRSSAFANFIAGAPDELSVVVSTFPAAPPLRVPPEFQGELGGRPRRPPGALRCPAGGGPG
jgi:hypothetical protein